MLIAVAVLTTMVTWLFAVGRGLRRLRPWARWLALSEAILTIAIATGFLISIATPSSSGSSNPAGIIVLIALIPGPIVVLTTFVACQLSSKRISVLFTPSYREVVLRTKYLERKKDFYWDRGFRRTLRLNLRAPDDRLLQIACRFRTREQCEHWAGRLAEMMSHPCEPAAERDRAAFAEPIPMVLLRQRPMVRFQLLGVVEAEASMRRTAEARLQVRAAMLGADSVVDLQEEFLPDFHQTARRLTGKAVRAVDAEGRFEFRSRWCSDRVARVGTLALSLLLISLLLTLLSSLGLNVFEQIRLEMMTVEAKGVPANPDGVGSNLKRQVLRSFLIIVAIHAWPIALVALVRSLRWPQFVRPLTVTIVAFTLRPVYLLIGCVSATVLSGSWSGLVYYSALLLDPVSFSMLVIGLLLGRTAWRADTEFRRLAPDSARKVPQLRSIGGKLAMAASMTYAAILACFMIWGCYVDTSQFRLPTEDNRKNAAALAEFSSGIAFLQADPARAEQQFRSAATTWENLAHQSPSEVELRINLEAARTNLALAALAQGRVDEGREGLTRSSARWEALMAGPVSGSNQSIIDKNRSFIRSTLSSFEFAQMMTEGSISMKAGDLAKAETVYRRALETCRGSRDSLSPDPLLAKREAMACNDLAWLFAVAPGRSQEQIRESVTLGERAVALEPQNGGLWNTLALARYRANDWPGADSAIERSMQLRGGGDANDWLILAMIRWHQGDQAEARRRFDQASSQTDRQPSQDEVLRRLRDEAATLLGISRDHP